MNTLRKLTAPDQVYLQPGEFHFGGGNACIHTLLGSCVSITLWHPGLRIGGMCHFMLPSRDNPGMERPDGRYADESLQLFLEEISKHDTQPGEYQAKLFGGGNMFQAPEVPRAVDVGSRNIEAARRLLGQGGFLLHAEHVGGSGHRRIFFDLCDGNVWVKHEKSLSYPLG